MVYFLVSESQVMYEWLLATGVDMLMINDDSICIDAGLCPSTNNTLARSMCVDAPDGSGACELELGPDGP